MQHDDCITYLGEEERNMDTLKKAVEFLRGAAEDAFVKHVSAVALRIL